MNLLLTPHLHLFLSAAQLAPRYSRFYFHFFIATIPIRDVYFFHYARRRLNGSSGYLRVSVPLRRLVTDIRRMRCRKQRLHFLCFPAHNEFNEELADETNVFVDKRLIFTD